MAYQTATELRAAVTAIQDSDKFPDDRLDELVAEFESIAEDYRGVAYEPRTATETHVLSEGGRWLRLRWPDTRSVTSVTITSPSVGGTSTVIASDGYLAVADGYVHYPVGFAGGTIVVVVYAHGADDPPPSVVRACREYVRACALTDRSGVPRDVIAQSEGGSYTRFSTPDRTAGRPTGFLEVDRLLNSLPDRRRVL